MLIRLKPGFIRHFYLKNNLWSWKAIIFLIKKMFSLGRENFGLGRKIISLTWKIIFLGRKIFDQKGKIPFETGKTAFFGRKTISDGISKAEQGSFAPKPPVPWPVRSQCPFSILPRV